MVSIYQSIARDSRAYQYKKQIDTKLKESEARKKRKALKESTNVNITPDGSINVNIDTTPVTTVPEVIEPEVVEEIPTEEVIEEGCKTDESKEVKECGPEKESSKDGEKTITETNESEEITESETEEEIGENAIDTVLAKISAEDEELANRVKEILSKDDSEEPEVEEVSEEIIEEPLEECEITSYKITRIAPKSNVYMLEAQTKEGLRYITGKNFNEETKILDEAELSDDKVKASNRFRELMKGE